MHSKERNQTTATVIANNPVCRDHYRLILSATAFPPTHPGQFVQVACRDLAANYSPETEFEWEPGKVLGIKGQELMSPLAMLRRPFSLAGRRDTPTGIELEILHRVVGTGTRWLSTLQAGQELQLIGPLGNHFYPPPADTEAILVGGGVGIPPMLYLAEQLAGRKAVVFCGAMTQDLLPLTLTGPASPDGAEPRMILAEFSRHGVPSVVTTDDGSCGMRGLVTEVLEKYLDAHPGERRVIYTCGPEGMMKRVAAIALARGITCQVSVERAMACGMGTCQSCVIRLRDVQSPDGWRYRLACTDGPVFSAEDLMW